MFKLLFEGTLTPLYEITLVSVPTDPVLDARNREIAEQRKRELGPRHITHPFNSIPRKFKVAA